MAQSKRSSAKARQATGAKVSVEFDYAEASLLVVAANVIFGALPDNEMRHAAGGLLKKLYAAEPRLKADARRIEAEMRGFLAPDKVDADINSFDMEIDSSADPALMLNGGGYLDHIEAAMAEGRSLALLREDGAIALRPTGVGQIGSVAVAIGWSPAHEDYTLVRLDEIIGIGPDKPTTRPPASDPVRASLDRLCRKPSTRGSLL